MEGLAERIGAHLQELVVKIGPRVMGSREDQAAIEYICGQLESWGVTVRRHVIAAPCMQHNSTRLISHWTGEEYPAMASQYCAAADVLGETIVLKSLDDANNLPVAGKICLAPGGLVNGATERGMMALALEARGAAALLVSREHQSPDAYDGKWVREPDLRKMPSACVSQRVMDRLVASASPLRLVVDAQFWWGHTCNIEAVVPGPGEGRVFVSAHRDTGAGTPGAWDDGCAVAIAMEMARTFAQEAPPCEVRFVFTGAHERLGQGIRDYVRDHGDIVRGGVMALNMDGVGGANRPKIAFCRGSAEFAAKLQRLLDQRQGWVLNTGNVGLGDGGPVAQTAGCPGIMLSSEVDNYTGVHHTQLDDMSVIDLAIAAEVAQLDLDIIRSRIWE